MQLSFLDIAIITVYIAAVVSLGIFASRAFGRSARGYFLAGNRIPWPVLGMSNASGMFDISGTMWMVSLLFVYGVKSIFISWLWPSFNQIFLMMFLSVWLRRSGVMTGAEWIRLRFGESRGANLSHLIVVVFALLGVLGFLAYGFIGIGKFAAAFLPWQLSTQNHLNEICYGLIITALTVIYLLKGGLGSVVITEVLQFVVMTIACIAIGVIAMIKVTPEMLARAVPDGWMTLHFGWELEIDWSQLLPLANDQIASDGYSFFSVFIMLVLFKGILQSLAGPAPNYDMQRILSARSPSEAAKMSGFVSVVLLFPRYMMITGLTVLALVFFTPQLKSMGSGADFEQILPFAITNFLPAGVLGLVVAGLLATFMSTFAATANAAPAYIVNDIYRRYINPQASEPRVMRLSYIVTVVFVILGCAAGIFMSSLNSVVMWLVSALYGGYTASNLLKWYWWRFNAIGYFGGMVAGLFIAIPLMFTALSPLYVFPVMFAVCLATCIVGSLLTPADDMRVLKAFYLKTRPWGAWQPVIAALQKDNISFTPNRDMQRDLTNTGIGLIWHTCLGLLPIFLVVKIWHAFFVTAAIALVTSVYLKKHWWNKLAD
ncbi:sodium:solute symporter family protein [Alteromonas gilva]|uniref:Na+:solute symporter n=1 Tax=Alteromonas gilva TaxID=2987522 RepID=A0ABT5L1B7_9ALTE|nr:sodium:solute symporter family protein [Alteromonas gilva]MDC8830199.1 Na+:solute symporter [Alteromonas gilva]